jgi:hypothetical protein
MISGARLMIVLDPLMRMLGQVVAPAITVSAIIERDAANIIASTSGLNRSSSQREY